MKKVFFLAHAEARKRAIDFLMNAPDGFCVSFSQPNRSLEQNATQWPILEEFSSQLKWPVNGEMVFLTAEEWKDILTAAFRSESPRLAAGLNGGVVMLGCRTRDFKKGEFSEWLDFLHSVASEKNIALKKNNAIKE